MIDPNRPIALFIPGLNGGGAQKVVVNLANALLDQLPCPVQVVLARRGGEFEPELHPDVQRVYLDSQRALRSILPLARYLRQQRPQVLISSMNYANVCAAAAVRLAPGICSLVVREDNVLVSRARVLHMLMRWTYPKANAVVCISQPVLESLAAYGIKLGGTAAVIGNPISVSSAPATASDARLLADMAQPFLVAVGRLTRQKGFDILLRGFAAAGHPDLQLCILGEGEQRSELETLARELGIADRVYLPGFVQNPAVFMRASSGFVLSSRWEGFGNVLVEALAVGTPVLAADCAGAPRDILENGRYGQLVPADDADALAQGISRLAVDPVSTPQERRARAADFSAGNIAAEYISLMEGMRDDANGKSV